MHNFVFVYVLQSEANLDEPLEDLIFPA